VHGFAVEVLNGRRFRASRSKRALWRGTPEPLITHRFGKRLVVTVTVQQSTDERQGSGSGGAWTMHRFSMGLIWWMAAAVMVCLLAVFFGATRSAAAIAAAMALTPAVIMLSLTPRWGETWAQVLTIFSWLLFAVLAVTLTGGPVSPALPAFALAPAVALWTGLRDRVVEATLFALLGYMAAAAGAALVALQPPSLELGPLPSILGLFGLAFSGAFAAAHPWPRARAPVVATPALVVPAPQAPIAALADNTVPLPSQRVAELSHELRTPLTHIIGFAELMEKQVFGPLHDRYVEYAGLIRSSGAHLLGLVNDMLDVARLEEGGRRLDLEEFDARDIAREVIATSRPAADAKRVLLSLDAPNTPLVCRADPRALRQILVNTVANAIKFSPDGGLARLTVRADRQDLVLETADSGPGIPAAERESLGARFVRGGSGAGVEGVGLGLAIVKGLAGLHGGHLSFDTAPEGGALVRVVLPVMATPAP